MTQADGDYGLIDYAYDAVGNRTVRTIDDGVTTTTETSTIDTFSNRLLSVDDGSAVRSITYTVDGNFALDNRGPASDLDFLYNDAGRLKELLRGGLSEALYTYNALGQRVIKDPATGPGYTHRLDALETWWDLSQADDGSAEPDPVASVA